MLSRVLVLCAALALSVNACARGIYKCISGGETSYQSMPCADGWAEEVLAIPHAEAPESAREHSDARVQPALATASTGLAASPDAPTFQTAALHSPRVGDSLALGTTDDQTLNTPGWGVPKKIVRSRERAGWREVWTYARRAGGAPQLEFLNGRLVNVGVQPEPVEMALR